MTRQGQIGQREVIEQCKRHTFFWTPQFVRCTELGKKIP